jgi:hypothetical protein
MMQASSDSALQALVLDAELAGAAMACRYASSDEYEAALIAERRRAGAYRTPRRFGLVLWVALAAAALLSIAISL